MKQKINRKIVLIVMLVLSLCAIVIPTIAQDTEASKVLTKSLTDESNPKVSMVTSSDDFIGSWENVDQESRGMISFIITEDGSTLNFHGYGSCSPTPCDWGKSPMILYSKSISDTEDSKATVEYDFGFVKTRIFLTMLNSNLILAQSFNEYTDESSRHNYFSEDYFSTIKRLATPKQLSPADGSVFDHYPRKTTLEWESVPNAVSYTIEIDCYQCCEAYKWCTDIGTTWKIVPDLTTTSFTFNFVGAQPGRWRVWAVDANGQGSPKSSWWEFKYTV